MEKDGWMVSDRWVDGERKCKRKREKVFIPLGVGARKKVWSQLRVSAVRERNNIGRGL